MWNDAAQKQQIDLHNYVLIKQFKAFHLQLNK